jgi:hypothetical protein
MGKNLVLGTSAAAMKEIGNPLHGKNDGGYDSRER